MTHDLCHVIAGNHANYLQQKWTSGKASNDYIFTVVEILTIKHIK